MTPQDHIWGVDIYNSSYGLIQGNVVITGTGPGLPWSRHEIDNMIQYNFVCRSVELATGTRLAWMGLGTGLSTVTIAG